jgi:DNA-binding CsgD family transcriptional regulator
MSIDARVLDVIESIYDASLDETRWPSALKNLTDFTGSQAASFWVLDSSAKPRLPTFTSINFDPAFIQEYLDFMAPFDPHVQYLVAHPNQPIVHDGMFLTEAEKDRHPYFDWHGRFSDTRFRLIGQMCPAPLVQAGVALHRRKKIGRFELSDIEQFGLLHRHLERALAIGFRLGTLGTLQKCTTAVLDSNPAAVLLLDENRRVLYLNRSAEELLVSSDGLRSSSADGLVASRKQDNDELQDLIRKALSHHTTPDPSVRGAMRVLRPSGKRPYAVLVAPVPRDYPALSLAKPGVCVIITDPDGARPFDGYRLKAAFGLTDAEARLAALLATGVDLKIAAEKLDITYGTARARLAVIFQKTETGRQGELIKVLLTTLAIG